MHLGFAQLCQVQNWQLIGEPKDRKHVKDAFKFIHLFIRPSRRHMSLPISAFTIASIFKELSLFCNWTAYSKNLFDSSCWLKPLKKNLKIGQVFLDNGIDGQLSREGFCASDFQVACFFYGRGGDGENRGGPGHTDRAPPGPMCKPGANLANPNSAPKNATPLLLAKI